MSVLTSLANNNIPQLCNIFMPRIEEIENIINTGCYEIHLFDYAYGTWLPNSGYEIDKRADFERYGDQYLGPESPEPITELWTPIK